MWAHVNQNKVIEITSIDPSGRFPDNMQWIPCDSSVKVHFSYIDGVFSPPEKEPLTLLAKIMINKVNDEYLSRMGEIASLYPSHERESWPVQLQEARELQNNPAAVTPWIDSCAAQRGMTREELAGRIVTKDLAYREVSGFLTGVRQRHEDEIDALLEAGEASREVLQDYHWAEYWDELTQ